MIKNGGSKPPPYDEVFSCSLREGATAGTRLGESAVEKNNKTVNLANAGSFRHGSAVPPPSRREA